MSITPEPLPPDIYAWRPKTKRPNGSPWVTIWAKPRATVRHILDTTPYRWVHGLAIAGGVAEGYCRAVMKDVGDEMALASVLGLYFVIGAVSGLITLYVGGWCLTWAGWWLGGRGTFPQVRAALAWGQVPIIGALVLFVIGLFFFGHDLFASYTPAIDAHPALALSLLLIYLVLVVWWVVVEAKCLGGGASIFRLVGAG